MRRHGLERIRRALDRLRDVAINTGVSGWTAGDVPSDVDRLVGRFAPDVVSVSLGTNDVQGEGGVASFRGGLEQIVDRAKAPGVPVVLHTPVLTLADAPDARRRWLPAYAEQVRQPATERGLSHVGHEVMAATTLRTLGVGELEGHS